MLGALTRPLRSGTTGALLLCVLLLGLIGCGTSGGTAGEGQLRTERGEASYYAGKFIGRPTASGEIYDPTAMTAAHRRLAFGTTVRVTRLDTEASVVVRINDRGPFKAGRIIDLSREAARRLDMIRDGIAPVHLQIVDGPTADTASPPAPRGPTW
jgi:rare lipoprotein A